MKRITTKVGDLFMEAEDGREESDRIKLYDSYSRYLDYLPLESVSPYETVEQYCNKRLEECDSVDEVLKYLGISSYTTGKSWTHLLEDIYSFDGYDYDSDADKYYELPSEEEITRDTVLKNECVNIIGSTYILRCD